MIFQFFLKQVVKSSLLNGRIALRAAISAISSRSEPVGPVVMGIGLGLTVLATVGQIDSNLRNSIVNSIPERAPSFFFIDIQSTFRMLFVFVLRVRSNTDPNYFWTPPSSDPCLALPRCPALTKPNLSQQPHMGSGTRETREAMGLCALSNIRFRVLSALRLYAHQLNPILRLY